MLTEKQREKLEKQQYRIIGNHSVVKICFWNKEAIKDKNKVCYKEHFYGVHCGNCLEMSPIITCNQRCLHCWRDNSVFSERWEGEADDPKEIIKKAIEARKKLLIGFKGRENTNQEQLEKFFIPDHAAISLTGEPTLYPKLPQMIDSYFDDFNFRTVFLVTNGTQPEMLKKFGQESKHFPTNIYLSLEAYNQESYNRFNNPVNQNTWEKVKESMQYLSKIKEKTRTILRITAVKGYNMDKAKEFVQWVNLMQPTFIEIKSYAFMGYSRQRLKEENVPSWEESKQFAHRLGELSGYKISAEHEPSAVIQLEKE